MKAKSLLFSSCSILLISCGGGGADSGGSGNANSISLLPQHISLVQKGSNSQNAQSKQSLSLESADSYSLLPQAIADPLPGSSSNYGQFQPTIYGVKNASDIPLDFANSVLCFVDQTHPEDNIGTGAYRALVSEQNCFEESPNVDYLDVTVLSEQNNGQYSVNLWWADVQGVEYKIHFEINHLPSTTMPYGDFTMYLRQGSNLEQANQSADKIYMRVTSNSAEETYHVQVLGDFGDTPSITEDMRFVAEADIDGAYGSVSSISGSVSESSVFNSSYILQTVGNNNACYDLNNLTEIVTGYSLFYANTGDAVTFEKGFGFTYDDNGTTKHGWVDGFGLAANIPGNPPFDVTGYDDNEYRIHMEATGAVSYIQLLENGQPTDTISLTHPITFAYTADNNDLRNSEDLESYQNNGIIPLTYAGIGSMPLVGTSIQNGVAETLQFNFLDGVQLTNDSINYVVKAAEIFQEPTLVTGTAPSACTSLTTTDFSSELTDLAFDNISDNFLYSTSPTDTGKIKYVAGGTAE